MRVTLTGRQGKRQGAMRHGMASRPLRALPAYVAQLVSHPPAVARRSANATSPLFATPFRTNLHCTILLGPILLSTILRSLIRAFVLAEWLAFHT